jgi:hypothetical protein
LLPKDLQKRPVDRRLFAADERKSSEEGEERKAAQDEEQEMRKQWRKELKAVRKKFEAELAEMEAEHSRLRVRLSCLHPQRLIIR